MTGTDTPDQPNIRKTVHAKDVVEREIDGDEREVLRVPVSSTRQDREGDAFSEDDLRDSAAQIRDQQPLVFDDHGGGMFGPGYSARETIGTQFDAEVEEADDDHHVLYAYINPDHSHEEGERMLRQVRDEKQAVKFSVGFRILQVAEDMPEDEQPERAGDVPGRLFTSTDLMETSRVGIPANPDASAAVAAKGDSQGVVDDTVFVAASRQQLLGALAGGGDAGFAAKSDGGDGKPKCESDDDCPDGQMCEDGHCVDEDDDEDSASVEALRDELDALRADVDDLRDDDGDGDDDGESCEVDTDCPEGEVCVEGECVPEDEVDDPDGEDDASYADLRAEIDALREEIRSGTGTPESANTDATADADLPEHTADATDDDGDDDDGTDSKTALDFANQ